MARRVELYLVRHAIAEERGPNWPDDTRRPLTAKGKARFRQVVSALRSMDVRLDVVLSSPLVRARQTADLLAAGLEPAPAVTLVDALAPGATPEAIVAAARRVNRGRVACVGHEPDLGAAAAHFLGVARPLAFKKGGICRIDFDTLAGPGELVWFAPPRLLVRAAD
jgi:phosphohistidine phosphatase